MNKFIFKYNKENYLIKYIEIGKNGIECYIFIDGNKVIKYDKFGKQKKIVIYSQPVKIMQRFQDGESWITIVPDNAEYLHFGYQPAKIEKEYILDLNNNIKKTNFSKNIIKKCKIIIKNKIETWNNETQEEIKENDFKFSLPIY